MQVWNVLHAARWNYRMQNIAKNSPSAHHRTVLSGYIFATKTHRQSEKTCKQQYMPTCLHNMVNFGPLSVEIGLLVWAPQQISTGFASWLRLATSLNGSQPNFARCLTVFWAGTLCKHFRGLLPRNGILPGAKFTLRPSLVLSYIGSVTARHSSSGRQLNFATLSRKCHLYSAGRPSRWASAHILVYECNLM